MTRARPFVVAPVLLAAACAREAPPPVAPASVLGDGPAELSVTALDGPFASLDEAPAPHGAARATLIDARPGAPFVEASLLVYRDKTGALPARCAVALRLDRGWYVGPSVACERTDPKSAMSIEALAIERAGIAGDTPQAEFWFLERTRHDDPALAGDEREEQRTMVIVCRAPAGAAPACTPAAPRERGR